MVKNNEDIRDAARISRRINDFCCELSRLTQGGSFVLSPFCAYMVLASLSNGATGTAYEQLRAALYPSGMSADEFNRACAALTALLANTGEGGMSHELKTASLAAVGSEYALTDGFAAMAKDYFGTDTISCDFADASSALEINEWAREATDGLIPALLSGAIDGETAVMLLCAVYFSGRWKSAFDVCETEESVFFSASEERSIPMMAKEAIMLYRENEVFQAVRLPYYGDAYMDVYLPKAGNTPEEVLSALDGAGGEYRTCFGLLKLPRFSVQSETDLRSAMKAMGITAVFEGGLEDLACGSSETALTAALQAAVIEADEEGSKAAAVTAAFAGTTGLLMADDTFEMVCDRPFAFTISVRAQGVSQIIFIGAYA